MLFQRNSSQRNFDININAITSILKEFEEKFQSNIRFSRYGDKRYNLHKSERGYFIVIHYGEKLSKSLTYFIKSDRHPRQIKEDIAVLIEEAKKYNWDRQVAITI